MATIENKIAGMLKGISSDCRYKSEEDTSSVFKEYFENEKVKRTLELYSTYQKPAQLKKVMDAFKESVEAAESEGKLFKRARDESKEIVGIIAEVIESAEGHKSDCYASPGFLEIIERYPAFAGFVTNVLSRFEKDERSHGIVTSISGHISDNISKYKEKLKKGACYCDSESQYVRKYCDVSNAFNCLDYGLRELGIAKSGRKAWEMFMSYKDPKDFAKFVNNFLFIHKEKEL